jgi:predicted CoA-substrate-specific enzyme activase
MTYNLGVDVGSVSVKLCLIDETGNPVRQDVEKVSTGPRAAVSALIARLTAEIPAEQITAAGVSGSGAAAIPPEMGWSSFSSSLAIASGVLRNHPDARTIIQIGGQSSLIIELEDGLRRPWKVESNPLCAAGTGRFLEQQAYRLGISIEDFARLALQCDGLAPRIAARCSVFAKTDLIHLQQKGVTVAPMLYALCESVARMVGSFKKGPFVSPIYFVGGVAANAAIARALEDVVSTRNGEPTEVTVPEGYLHMQALGTAILTIGKRCDSIILDAHDEARQYFKMPPLEPVDTSASASQPVVAARCEGYLGIDIGSTSTKAAIIDEQGNVLTKHYLMTAGRPVDAVKQLFARLLEKGADKVTIRGVGITGSGRYLVGSLVGADLIKNEITAQTRAAADLDPEADIIEIGGQDSKLVIKRNGVVVDYQMNKACAAGTGSFIDELAEMLGIRVTNGEFAGLAFNAPYTIDLGTRCASFMAQSVSHAQQEGTPLEVITASLAIGIAKNYLSKVVENRRLGNRIILTGAVFYNQAVVSAFQRELPDRELRVPEHKEISGAIGAALLAAEDMAGRPTRFKGFQAVVDADVDLSTFTCKGCDNNCTITRMQVPGESATFYGSRCDRYDAAAGHARQRTAFDDREDLLFAGAAGSGENKGPRVGIPRALLVYDFAPLLIGFVNGLGATPVVTGRTTGDIIAVATELAYTDSCFPVKVLHGHAAQLKDTDYILYPSAIRLGRMEGQENQKYACPLVQASPYIIRQTVGLEDRLLIPSLDFSRGDEDVIRNLVEAARKMGYSRKQGRAAAKAGLRTMKEFQERQAEKGRELLAHIKETGQLGVVLFARSYMSQDSGANLGIAEKLAQLGVVPIPLDYLPLSSVDPKDYQDRPYWYYESKFIAGAKLVAAEPQLFGLALTNFGCGPNSFMLRMVQDIMGGKPLGQLEIDEHAAEAGIVTRLEAFVDTIVGYARTGQAISVEPSSISRHIDVMTRSDRTLLVPYMSPHAEVIGASMQGYGVKALVLPEPDSRVLHYADKVTSGVECLPFRVTLGSFLQFYYENGHDTSKAAAFMASAYGPCRLGHYAGEQLRVFQDLGLDLPMFASVSNNGYRDMQIGSRREVIQFVQLAWKGCVAADILQKLLWRSRPYEKEPGSADRLFRSYLDLVNSNLKEAKPIKGIISRATSEFKDLIDPSLPRRPLVGINGEIFLRSNDFSNQDLVRRCEEVGLEVIVSPMAEWMKYVSRRNVEDAVHDKSLRRMVMNVILERLQERMERTVESECAGFVESDPPTRELLQYSRRWLSSRCGSEAVLSIGSGVEWMENPHFAGVVSVMPHGCMPGGIVAAMSERFSAIHKKPWINVTYDGILESANLTRIQNFAEIIRFCRRTDGTIHPDDLPRLSLAGERPV